MSLKQIPQKIKSFLHILAIFMVLADIYVLGILYLKPVNEVVVVSNAFEITFETEKEEGNMDPKTGILASKNGTKYYFIHCSGANRIKEENKIYFSSIGDAENRGLERAKNCN